jgi:hypothetical protein
MKSSVLFTEDVNGTRLMHVEVTVGDECLFVCHCVPSDAHVAAVYDVKSCAALLAIRRPIYHARDDSSRS